MKTYWVYILTNYTRTILYIGVTNNLERRMAEHKAKTIKGFTRKYNCTILVYYEKTNNIEAAIEREKQLKKWRRAKKEKLIGALNPEMKDLSTTVEMTIS